MATTTPSVDRRRGRAAGTPRWPPTPTASRPRSRSSAGRTSASRACSTRCSARTGRSSRRSRARPATRSTRALAWGRSEVVLIDTAGIRRRGKVASGPAAERYSTLRALQALVAGRRRRPGHRRRRGPDRPGRPRRRLRRRGGQGPRRRGQQVGPRRRQDGPDLRPVRRVDPQRGAVPRLRARSSRSAPRPASGSGGSSRLAIDIWGERRKRDPDRRAQPGPDARPPTGRRRRRSAATARSSSTPPRPPSRRRPSSSSPRDAGVGPLQLPALPREPAARRRSASTARRSGSSSATGRRSSCRAAANRSRAGAPGGRRAKATPGAAGSRRRGPASRADGRGRGSRSSGPGRGARRWPRSSPRVEPVTLLCHSPRHGRARSPRTRRNERRLPGVDAAGARSSPPPTRRPSPTRVDLVDLRRPVGATCARRSRGWRRTSSRTADLLSVVKGLEHGHAAADDRGHRRGGRRADRRGSRRCPARTWPLEIARGLPASAVVAARRTRRSPSGSSRGSAGASSGCTSTATSSGVELCGALKNIVAIAAGRGRRARLRRQRQGRADDPRPGRDDPARDRRRRQPADVRRAGRDRRRHRDLRLEPVAQPPARRGAGARAARGPRSRRRCRASPRAPTRSTPPSRWPSRLGVEMPIAREVHNALFEGKSVQRCLIDLLARESKDELADYERWVERLGRPAGE